jgi:hypothetical protein
MKLPLKEPLSARYLYVSPDNIVHVFMPVVSGTSIGLDNTCKAVYSLQEFFGKGSNSNKKVTLEGELLAYKEALESDLSLLGADSELSAQKQERLSQIQAYLEVIAALEKHRELDCLNSGFPSYPRPLESLMQDRSHSNLYSMVLRPSAEDGYLRTEAANPIFSVAHKSVARGIEGVSSTLQQALIKAYFPLNYETSNLKAQVISQVLAQLPGIVPVDFERLRHILTSTVSALVNASIDFTKTQQGNPLTQDEINKILAYDSQTTTAKEYIDALLGYCAPNLFDTVVESPFSTLTQAERWSIATQFLLGITNIYCVSQGKINAGTNFGQILDSNPALSTHLAETLAQAQQANRNIEEACLSWVNAHATELKLNTPLTPEDVRAIKQTFASHYSQIKESPHFDEFFVFDSQKKGNFAIHQGSICTSFAKFACSPLFDLPKDLTQPLEKVQNHVSTLSTEIPHKNPLVQGEVDIDTSAMDTTQLQVLYERINTYKDPKLKEQLLAQLKQERPDFKPQIDAKQFMQQVAYGEQNEAENVLKKDVQMAQELLTASNIPFTDYSGRTFTCTAYEYAYWAKDTHMCRMLEKYMNAHTKQILLERVQRIEELIGNEFIKKPRGLTYTQKGKDYCSAHFDLTPLKQALKAYIDAYNQSPKQTDADWEALDALWIKVGLPQREVPAHVAQEYCHPKRSFKDVSENPSLLDASNSKNLERSLKFYNYETGNDDSWFTRDSYSAGSGLGSQFAAARAGADVAVGMAPDCGWEGGWSWRMVVGCDLAAIEAIDKARTEDLKQSFANLAQPILQSQPSHGH